MLPAGSRWSDNSVMCRLVCELLWILVVVSVSAGNLSGPYLNSRTMMTRDHSISVSPDTLSCNIGIVSEIGNRYCQIFYHEISVRKNGIIASPLLRGNS